MDALGSALRKGGIRDPLLFLPVQKRSQPGVVVNHFKAAGLPQVAEYWQKRAAREAREGVISRLAEMRAEESTSTEDVVEFLQEQRARTGLAFEDFAPIVFDGLIKSIEDPAKLESPQVVKEIQAFAPTLEPFTPSPKSEIALINKVQLFCHEHAPAQKSFANILKVLYNDDVLSDQAIIYWATKGARSEGKQAFLQQAAPLVKYLEEQSDDEDDE